MHTLQIQGFIQPRRPPDPPKFESTPQARRKVPPQAPQKILYVTKVYKMKKSWKIGEKWIKNQFSIEIFYM